MNKIKPRTAEDYEWLDRVKEVMNERKCSLYTAINEVEEETKTEAMQVVEC